MKKTLVILGLVPAALFLLARDATSCSDKFLVIGRGLRYERTHAASHPASILIYALSQEASKDLQSTLHLAGHQIKSISDEDQLYASLNSTHYDVVLVSLADVSLLERKIMATSSRPVVLPVIYKATGPALDASEQQYPCILKYKDKNRNAVAVIDQVMDERLKGKPT